MKSKLDRYVSNLDLSDKRPTDNTLGGYKRTKDDDTMFRGFKRVDGKRSTITYGHNAQRTGDAEKFKSVEGGTKVKSSMKTGGDHEYTYKGSSGSGQHGEATKGSVGGW